MPPRDTYAAGPALPHLSEIIKLEPQKEPWCAGYAPSQGRRCHVRTNANGRSSAITLLHEGTKDLCAGRRIDSLLEDLAPHVLCTRFHQSQASDLARRWKGQVRSFLDSQVTSTRSERIPSQPPQRVYSETSQGDMEERAAVLYRRLHDTMEGLRHLEAGQHGQAAAPNSPRRNAGHANADTNFSSTRRSSIRDSSPMSSNGRIVTRQSTESINRSTIITPRPTQAQAVSQARPVSVSNHRPATVSTVAHVSNRASVQEDPESTSVARARVPRAIPVTRQAVEGECGICLCDLQTTRSNFVDETVESDEEEDDDEEDVEDEEEEEEEGEGEEEELVWCKARCGVNFHQKCIDKWLETSHAPTCPACRSNWRR